MEYNRRAIPANIKPMPTKKIGTRCERMAACGNWKESAKSAAIPIHKSSITTRREPRSDLEESLGALLLETMNSGTIQRMKVIRNITA